ncbi:hypothetical protein U5801_00425 [Lamprobacter modestohalophilus]|uniref:hypothetical protein n=1 Tax=Lamprobacter modestohalophilus TaxID=1064514 RepID=UPI002ADEC357|nr:hypothetical protein [Lamprobacter modestohalophilus]MEA1048289.1 hypothetical protein [Lamprobacter modestohalophilus]
MAKIAVVKIDGVKIEGVKVESIMAGELSGLLPCFARLRDLSAGQMPLAQRRSAD